MSLAEQLATAWLKAQKLDVALDWPNLPSEERAVWERVAEAARQWIALDIVTPRRKEITREAVVAELARRGIKP